MLKHLKRWSLPVLTLGAAIVLAVLVWDRLRDDVWAYYTDDEGIRVEEGEANTRKVLWEVPRKNLFEEKGGTVNAPTGRLEAAFSPDGTEMILVREGDMYLSRWDGRTWTPARTDYRVPRR